MTSDTLRDLVASGLTGSRLMERLDFYARSTKAVLGPKENPQTVVDSWADAILATPEGQTLARQQAIGAAMERLEASGLFIELRNAGSGWTLVLSNDDGIGTSHDGDSIPKVVAAYGVALGPATNDTHSAD